MCGNPLGGILGGGGGGGPLGGLGSMFGLGGGSSSTSPAPVAAPAPPAAPSLAPDRGDFSSERGSASGMEVPTFLGINSSMTPQQQATALATRATSLGNALPTASAGPYAGQSGSDVLKKFYKNLALNMYTDESGKVRKDASISDIERQMAEQTFGLKLQNSTAQNFLTRLFEMK